MSTATEAPHTASRACYLRGCPETGCREQHRRYCKQYGLDAARSRPRTVSPEPYIAQVRALVAAGWTHSAIAGDTGLSTGAIRDLAAGEPHFIYPDTADRLDRHRPAATPPNWWVDCTGTARRIQALAVMGWTQQAVAAELGMGYSTVRSIANGRRRHSPRATAQAVAALYARWSRKPGPSLTSRGIARTRGWVGPLAWDGNIDDPAARPDATGIGATVLPKRDNLRNDEIKHLAGFQLPLHEIAKRVGLEEKDVEGRLTKWRTEREQEAIAS